MLDKTEQRAVAARTILGIVNQGNVWGNLNQTLVMPGAKRAAIHPELPPQENLPSEDEVVKLLSWRTPIGPLVGRDDEISELKEWANSGAAVRVRLLSGPGGAGKSRLASELARKLRDTGEWTAGFVRADSDADIEMDN